MWCFILVLHCNSCNYSAQYSINVSRGLWNQNQILNVVLNSLGSIQLLLSTMALLCVLTCTNTVHCHQCSLGLITGITWNQTRYYRVPILMWKIKYAQSEESRLPKVSSISLFQLISCQFWLDNKLKKNNPSSQVDSAHIRHLHPHPQH